MFPLRAYGYFELAIAALGGGHRAHSCPHLVRLSTLVTSYQQDANGWLRHDCLPRMPRVWRSRWCCLPPDHPC